MKTTQNYGTQLYYVGYLLMFLGTIVSIGCADIPSLETPQKTTTPATTQETPAPTQTTGTETGERPPAPQAEPPSQPEIEPPETGAKPAKSSLFDRFKGALLAATSKDGFCQKGGLAKGKFSIRAGSGEACSFLPIAVLANAICGGWKKIDKSGKVIDEFYASSCDQNAKLAIGKRMQETNKSAEEVIDEQLSGSLLSTFCSSPLGKLPGIKATTKCKKPPGTPSTTLPSTPAKRPAPPPLPPRPKTEPPPLPSKPKTEPPPLPSKPKTEPASTT